MEELVTVILAALGGLTYLAYNDPKAYEKLYLVLSIIWLLLLCGFMIWDVSNSIAASAAYPYIPYEKFDRAQKAIEAKKVTNSINFWCVYGGTYIYLLLLVFYSQKRKRQASRANEGGRF